MTPIPPQLTPIPPIPAYLKRWSPAARLEECGKPHGYMIGDKEGLWYFASAVDERIAKLTAEVALLESTITGIQETAGKQEELIERLERENTRLKAPVSDEEWKAALEKQNAEDKAAVRAMEPFPSPYSHAIADKIIASRAAIKEGQ